MWEEIFVIVVLAILMVVTLPLFILAAFIIFCQIAVDKEQLKEYSQHSLHTDGGDKV